MKQLSNGFWLPDTDQFFVNRPNYELRDYQISRKFFKTQQIALDIGAHCGFWSQRLAQDFEQVICFEPVPEHYECLCANTQKYTNIELHNVACGAQPGKLYMQQYFDNTGMSRIVDHKTDLPVSVVKLDDVLKPKLSIDFIKIDAENTEYSVLQGAEQLIKTHSPNLFVEILQRNTGVEHLLAEWGYQHVATSERNYIFVRSNP